MRGTVTIIDVGSVRVHSYMAPDDGLNVTTQLIEVPILRDQMAARWGPPGPGRCPGPGSGGRSHRRFAAQENAAREGVRGCAFINTVAEYALGTDAHVITAEHKRAVRAGVRDRPPRPLPWTPTLSRSSSHSSSTAR